MGTFYGYSDREQLVHELTHVQPGDDYEILKFSLRGNVVWSVVKAKGETFIRCDLIRKDDGEWGYKPLSEAEHPYYYTCPLSYLKLAPPTSPEWREMVRAHHEDVNARRRKRSPAKVSSITEWRTG